MRSAPVLDRREAAEGTTPATPTPATAGLARRAGALMVREFRELLPPTIFFIVGFNLIVLTTNLILANYGARFASFMIATVSALIVAKALLIANAMPAIRHYDRAPLIRPILFKTIFYWAAVFVVRLLEHWIRYRFSGEYVFGGFVPHAVAAFSWDRFMAIQLWILVLFLVYVTVSEFNHLFGEGELWHILLTSRPSDLPLNRRQRIRELIRLSNLTDKYSVEEFADSKNPAHVELIDIVSRLAAEPRRRNRRAA